MTPPRRPHPPRHPPPPLPAQADQSHPISKGLIAFICIGVMIGVIGLGLLIYSIVTKAPPAPVVADDFDRPKDRKSRKTQTAPNLNSDAFESEANRIKREADDENQAAQKMVLQPVQNQPKQETPVAIETPKAAEVQIEGPWDRTLNTLGGYIILSPCPQNLSGIVKADPIRLSQVHVADPRSIDLKIHSVSEGHSNNEEDSSLDRFVIKALDVETDAEFARHWVVQRPMRHPLTKTVDYHELGTFSLSNQTLSFQWNMKTPNWAEPNSLLHCLLELSKDNQSHTFRLSRPSIVEPLVYDLKGKSQKLDLSIQANAVADPKSLYLDLELSGIGSEPFVKEEMKVGETAKFSIENPEIKLGDPSIDFEITFQCDEKTGPHLVLNAYTTRSHMPPLTAKNLQNADRIPIGSLREVTVVLSFEKIKEEAKANAIKIRRQFNVGKNELPRLKQELARLERDLINEMDQTQRMKIQAEIDRLKLRITRIEGIFERLQALRDIDTWAGQMGWYFLEIQKSARVGYSLYLEIEGEKFILARTESAEPPAKIEEPE